MAASFRHILGYSWKEMQLTYEMKVIANQIYKTLLLATLSGFSCENCR